MFVHNIWRHTYIDIYVYGHRYVYMSVRSMKERTQKTNWNIKRQNATCCVQRKETERKLLWVMYSWKGLKLYVRINTRICVIGEGKRVCSQYIDCQHYILTHRTLTHSPHNHSICILFSLCSSSFLYKSIHKDYLYLSRFVCVCPSTGMKDPASCSFCRSVSVCVSVFDLFMLSTCPRFIRFPFALLSSLFMFLVKWILW